MEEDNSSCGACSICLNAISPSNEAFLDTCFHSFCYKCIKNWTDTQRRHPPQNGPRFACPLCKQPYFSIIHDCHENAFRQEQVAPPPQGSKRAATAVRATSFVNLTSSHRRRRSVYYSPFKEDARAALAPAIITPGLAKRPDVARWTERELQALMWQDDVALETQHVLGTLRSAAQHGAGAARPSGAAGDAGGVAGVGPVTRKRKAAALGSRGPAQESSNQATAEAMATAVSQAAAPYVFEHAERFGWELAGYVASGLTLAAYDKKELTSQATAVAALAAAPDNGGGAGAAAVEARDAGLGGGADGGRDAGGSDRPGTSKRSVGSGYCSSIWDGSDYEVESWGCSTDDLDSDCEEYLERRVLSKGLQLQIRFDEAAGDASAPGGAAGVMGDSRPNADAGSGAGPAGDAGGAAAGESEAGPSDGSRCRKQQAGDGSTALAAAKAGAVADQVGGLQEEYSRVLRVLQQQRRGRGLD